MKIFIVVGVGRGEEEVALLRSVGHSPPVLLQESGGSGLDRAPPPGRGGLVAHGAECHVLGDVQLEHDQA